MALGVIALFGMATLAVDVGYYRYQQRLQQSAADSASLAGGIEQIYSAADVVAAGQAASAQNAFTDDAGVTTTVTINAPPASGPNTATARAVEAIVSKKQPIFFGGVLSSVAYVTVSARAVAIPKNTRPGCLYTTSTTTGITLKGSKSGIDAVGCGIISNDTISLSGNGSVTASYVGYAQASSISCTGCITPPALIAPVNDACISFAGCAYLELNGAPTLTTFTTTNCASCALPSGEYSSPSGVTISGTSTLSGFYKFDHGLTITGAVSGTNVTIETSGTASITLSGSETSTLSAPTSGNYAGLLYYQPATDTGTITFNGNSGANTWTGLVYAPGMTLTTNGNEPTFSALVVNNLTDNGHNLTLNITGLTSATDTNHFVLAE